MASGGLLDAEDEEPTSKSNRSRPSYDGTRSAWPTFAILCKAYMRKKGIESLIVHGKQPSMSAGGGDR